MRALIPVVGQFIEALRSQFVEADPVPLGGAVTEVEHRPGELVALDALADEVGGPCSGQVWVNVLRVWRSESFPTVSAESSSCRSPVTIDLQVGAARRVCTVDDGGYPPSADAMGHDALVGLDDTARIDRAVCLALRACDDCGLTIQSVVAPIEPVGPQGGILAWTTVVTIQLSH